MTKFSVSHEGVYALLRLSDLLMTSLDELYTAKRKFQADVYGINNKGLGEHFETINLLIEAMDQSLENARQPVAELSKIIVQLAKGYQEMIDNDPYASIDTEDDGDSTPGPKVKVLKRR